MEKEKYEKILIELYFRIKRLEEEVAVLKHTSLRQDGNVLNSPDDEDGFNNRVQVREQVINKLREKMPDYIVMKATRSEGSGIKLVSRYGEGKPIRIKFSYSKCYHKRAIEHSWFTIQLSEIENVVDYCVFAMLTSNDTLEYFVFSVAEITGLCKTYHENDGNNVHLYFAIEENKAYEIRYDKADVTKNWNNWQILTEAYM